MKKSNLSILMFGLLLLQSLQVQANSIILEQFWEDGNITSNGLSARTVAVWDDSSLTGVGVEKILLDIFGMELIKFDIGQNYSVADFNEPRSLTTEGNTFAQYNNGIYTGLSNVDQGGNSNVTLRTSNLSGPVSGGYNWDINHGLGVPQIVWFNPISGSRNYDLVSSEFINVVVPVPAAAWLFSSGLIGLLGVARRKQTFNKNYLYT